jgi:hypothetical protein
VTLDWAISAAFRLHHGRRDDVIEPAGCSPLVSGRAGLARVGQEEAHHLPAGIGTTRVRGACRKDFGHRKLCSQLRHDSARGGDIGPVELVRRPHRRG